MAVVAAEAALRVSLLGVDEDTVDDVVHAVRSDPNRYRDKQNPRGDFARALLAAPTAIVPLAPAAAAPAMARQPSLIDVEPSRLANHKYFKPIGGEVKPDAPSAHHFSHLSMDHTVSGFEPLSEEEKAVRLVYTHLMYESKRCPCKEIPASFKPGADGTRGPFFTVREHDHAPPCNGGSHKEIGIFGATQLSKTPEAAASAWCAFFIDGCVPIIAVRNKGGANTGSSDMANGIWKLNELIERIFKHEVRSGNLKLREEDYKKLILHPRITSAPHQEQIEFDDNNLTLARPQVLIMCMNPNQVKNLIGGATSKAAKAGAKSGLLDIMKGNTNHPYPPKCHDPYAAFDDGRNRPVARLYFILDEDDLNRSDRPGVVEKLQYTAPAEVRKRLEKGLGALVLAGRTATAAAAPQAAGSSNDDPLVIDSDDEGPPVEPISDDEEEGDEGAGGGRPAVQGETEIDEASMRAAFKTEMSGVRSVVRGVIALTATPAACGHDLTEGASQVKHHICTMEHPTNYVGYEFSAAPYAERKIVHETVPDRKQLAAIKKAVIYEAVCKKHDWWSIEGRPMDPFQRRADGAITVRQANLDDTPEGGNKSSREIFDLVNKAHREASRRGDKVLESDGVGIALMLESMSASIERSPSRRSAASQELERRGLIISNYTKTDQQKIKLAHHILNGDLTFEDDTKLPERCYCDLFVIIFDHKNLRIMWRGAVGDGGSEDAYIPPDHDTLAVLNAISDASPELYDGARNKTKGLDPNVATDGGVKCFRSGFINVNHAYTALLLYAHRRRMSGQTFKLKTICLAGDLGGRGVNFKPHGFHHDPQRDTWIIPPHAGYLTDMFFMFDAFVNRQITTHGEYILQAIGRLCTLVNDEMLAKMAFTPPRLWTSASCYNIIRTFARGISQWVDVMRGKQPNESMKDALVRTIRTEPENYCHLWMIYAVPSNDPIWTTKQLWLRTSRLKKNDDQMRDTVRTAPRMPLTPANSAHGIIHNPNSDSRKRVYQAIQMAEASLEARDDDEEEEVVEQELPPRRRRRGEAAPLDEHQMRERFEATYANRPGLAHATNGRTMPTFESKIYCKWDANNDRYYLATVVDIEWNDVTRELEYTIEFDTNDDGTPVPDGVAKHRDVRTLDLGMMPDWSYDNPSPAFHAPLEAAMRANAQRIDEI